jgi:hypothetical protein
MITKTLWEDQYSMVHRLRLYGTVVVVAMARTTLPTILAVHHVDIGETGAVLSQLFESRYGQLGSNRLLKVDHSH